MKNELEENGFSVSLFDLKDEQIRKYKQIYSNVQSICNNQISMSKNFSFYFSAVLMNIPIKISLQTIFFF